MTLYQALKLVIDDDDVKIYRKDWNGVRLGLTMYVGKQMPDEHSMNTDPYLFLVTGKHRVPWLISQGDVFSVGWAVVEPGQNQGPRLDGGDVMWKD